MIQAQAANIKYGFAVGVQPFTIPNGTTLMLSLGANVSVWLVATTGSSAAVVAEIS